MRLREPTKAETYPEGTVLRRTEEKNGEKYFDNIIGERVFVVQMDAERAVLKVAGMPIRMHINSANMTSQYFELVSHGLKLFVDDPE